MADMAGTKGTGGKGIGPTGSGSRPDGGKVPIKDSTPTDMHTLGRSPPGWLK